MEPLLTTDEAAEILRISRWTVVRKASSGQIPYLDIGTSKRPRLRFTESGLAEYLMSRRSIG